MKLKNICNKIFVMICLISFMTLELIPVNAAAGPRSGPRNGFNRAPAGSQRVNHGKNHYVFHGGRFYRPGKSGYVYTRPPVGAVVYSLPAAAVILLAGLTYYVYDNIYYRKVPTGYVVVESPPAVTSAPVPVQTVTPVVPGTWASVIVQALNVRSGPGLTHPVKSFVRYGSRLNIQGTSQDWFYVILPDGSDGWVMTQFVSVTDTGAKG